jgi:hypothetical protein
VDSAHDPGNPSERFAKELFAGKEADRQTIVLSIKKVKSLAQKAQQAQTANIGA